MKISTWMMVDMDEMESLRIIEPRWNKGLIAVSIAISFLGAFTSTQLMCQAKMSKYMTGIVVWGMLSSLVFGFCSIWGLHFVATLACELDLPIGVDPGLTVLSSILAVLFTSFALVCDLVLAQYRRTQRRKKNVLRERPSQRRLRSQEGSFSGLTKAWMSGKQALRSPSRATSMSELPRDSAISLRDEQNSVTVSPRKKKFPQSDALGMISTGSPVSRYDSMGSDEMESATRPLLGGVNHTQNTKVNAEFQVEEEAVAENDMEVSSTSDRQSSDVSSLRRVSTINTESESSSYGGPRFVSIRAIRPRSATAKNLFMATALSLWEGLILKNILKGFLWSLAITGMHYVGILALKIPGGQCKLNPLLVLLSALISWAVCTIGTILMSDMELHIGRQILFAVIAAIGVAAMHFTGMRAATFISEFPPSERRGYPTGLPIAIVSIAITTCLVANFLLAHAASVSRNKLAEVVYTRRKLWAAIAQKENAEAAAVARSEFIASASHEIRTPLHQLQGYSDLLSRTNLSEESRLLLYAMQDATRALSMITNNVLDWSRLEKGEATCRPTALDVRSVCESIVHLLPTKDDEVSVDLMMVVDPGVPASLFIDETYLHRIVMNILSNSLKFTSSGYVKLVVSFHENKLIAIVSDTGCGIPESFLPQLFEPFKQAQTRGAHRGTGLGLSIVLQLLNKMQGTIKTESRHRDSRGVEPDTTGTKFTVEIPVQAVEDLLLPATCTIRNIAILGDTNDRALHGVRDAWSVFDVKSNILSDAQHVPSKYDGIWVDESYLRSLDSARFESLVHQRNRLVLVPFEDEASFFKLFHNSIPGCVVPLKKPLIWHKIIKLVADAQLDPDRSTSVGRIVRFASQVDVMHETDRTAATNGVADMNTHLINTPDPSIVSSHATPSLASMSSTPSMSQSLVNLPKSQTLLLVEDNKINARLGSKMLKTLGYGVLLAADGQQAVDMTLKHDSVIDAILMDQSMPIKDGLTATREIRALEADGTLKGPTYSQSLAADDDLQYSSDFHDHRSSSRQRVGDDSDDKDKDKKKNSQYRFRRPIIAVTAVVGPHAEAMCKDAGTDAFLAKPLSLEKLKEALEEFFQPFSTDGTNGFGRSSSSLSVIKSLHNEDINGHVNHKDGGLMISE